jgi:hypothetical protein
MDPNNLNNHLFDSDFQRKHGVSLQQAAEGYAGRDHVVARYLGKDLVSPEEQDEVWDTWKRTNQFIANQAPEGPVREVSERFFSEPVNLERVVRSWIKDNRRFLDGTPRNVARDTIALSNEIRGGRTPDVPIYRGGAEDLPTRLEKSPDLPISFTQDPYVARSFARDSYRGRGQGQTIKLPPRSGRGLFVPDLLQVVSQRTIGRGERPEQEWLMDPSSLRTKK